MADGQASGDEDTEQAHSSAFKADFGFKSGLGFRESNWTEVVRKLFVYVDHYDVRPHRGGHRGLCKPEDLDGQHIWVKAHSTTSSSKHGGPGTFVVREERVNIVLPTVEEVGWHLVEVDRSGGSTTGRSTLLLSSRSAQELVDDVSRLTGGQLT